MSANLKNSPQWLAYLRLMEERPEEFAPAKELAIVTDEAEVERFVRETGIQIGVLYQSAFRILVVDLVQGPDGACFAYERLLPAVPTDGVVAVPVQNGKFVLLRQFRHALRGEQYAFPRGFGEPGLTPEENVKKEVWEELRARSDSPRYLGRLAADSGLSGGYVSVYLCEITGAEPIQGYEGISGIVRLSRGELEEWIGTGRITDGFTLSAYSLYQYKKESWI